jgi:hypothetical protein
MRTRELYVPHEQCLELLDHETAAPLVIKEILLASFRGWPGRNRLSKDIQNHQEKSHGDPPDGRKK